MRFLVLISGISLHLGKGNGCPEYHILLSFLEEKK